MLLGPLCALLQAQYLSLAPTCAMILTHSTAQGQKCPSTSYRYAQTVSQFVRHLTLSLFHEISQQVYELHCDEVQGVSGNFSANCSCTKSLYLLSYQKTYSPRKTRSSIERTTVSKNWIKQLHTLPVLRFNRCLTTEYSQTAAHCNGNFGTDSQMYRP
jgi:hypothetical protein